MRFLTVLCLVALCCLLAPPAPACNPGVPAQAQFAPAAYDPGCVPAQAQFFPQRAFFAAPQYGYGSQAAFFPSQQRFVRQRGFAPSYGSVAAPLPISNGGLNINVNSGNAVQPRRGLFGFR